MERDAAVAVVSPDDGSRVVAESPTAQLVGRQRRRAFQSCLPTEMMDSFSLSSTLNPAGALFTLDQHLSVTVPESAPRTSGISLLKTT